MYALKFIFAIANSRDRDKYLKGEFFFYFSKLSSKFMKAVALLRYYISDPV